jgi:hypothetical protein
MKRRFAARAFVLGGMAFLVAAAVPVFRGEHSNTAFLAVGVAWFVIGLGMARRA